MVILKYNKNLYEEELMRLIEREGPEWYCYTALEVADKYKKALEQSITYVAYKENVLCGYARAINDNDFYIFICDLLVDKKYRGYGIGKMLMSEIRKNYPNQMTFVLSDVDPYYEKQGYEKEGSIYIVD